MNRQRLIVPTMLVVGIFGVLSVYFILVPKTARSDVQGVLDRVQQAGGYHFSADITQTTTPLSLVTNIGQQSREQKMRVEGSTDLALHALDLSIWSQGGSLLSKQDGFQARVNDEGVFVRQGNEDWEKSDDFTGLFAPEGDMMAYLVAVKDLVNEGTETRQGITFTRYTFQIDGRNFAIHLRDQMESSMAQKGELPPGMSLDLPRLYVDMIGEGELWVGENGFPLRQILQLQFPESQGERTETQIDATFTDFKVDQVQAAASIYQLQHRIERALQTGWMMALAVIPLILMVLHPYSKKVYARVACIVILSMLLSPLLESMQARAFAERQTALVQEKEQRQQESQILSDLRQVFTGSMKAVSNTEAGLPAMGAQLRGANEVLRGSPLFQTNLPLQRLPQETDTDTDQDGLTDYQEQLLGTDPKLVDTDGDNLSDKKEVDGFSYDDKPWSTNPLVIDTNQDSLPDGVEWNKNAQNGLPGDTDGDGQPDLFDFDNDGDGVPDDVDISPYQASTGAFDRNNPFKLKIDNLEPGLPTYVEFQLQPEDPNRLWYAYNVLDWPKDQQGQVQDVNDQTFSGISASEGMKANRNGDVKLLPMLEITISGSNDNLPDTRFLQEKYGILVQEIPGGQGKIVYVPLQLMTENEGGDRVAFYGKMFYEPDQSWDSQEVRLVWMVQALVDVCSDLSETDPAPADWPEGQTWEGSYVDDQCVYYAQKDVVRVIQSYYDNWHLTGLKVQENHDYRVGVIWEDPQYDNDRNSDDGLSLLTMALDHTFLAGRDADKDGRVDITIQELQRRFDGIYDASNEATMTDRWGIQNTFGVYTATFTHPDEAIATLGMTTTQTILDQHFTDYWSETEPITPTLLYLTESDARIADLDDVGSSGVVWNADNGQLDIDMDDLPAGSQLGVVNERWQPYEYDGLAWDECPIGRYWALLENRYRDLFSSESDAGVAQVTKLLLQVYYVPLYRGISSIVANGSVAFSGTEAEELDTDLAQEMASLAGEGMQKVGKRLFKQAIGQTGRDLTQKLLTKNQVQVPKPASKPGGVSRALGTAAFLMEASGALLMGLNMKFESKGVELAGNLLLGAAMIADDVVSSIEVFRMSKDLSKTAELGKAMKSARIAAAVGFVIELAVIWGTFGFQAGSAAGIAFDTMLAEAIAQTIMATILFILSLTVIGAVIAAVVAVIFAIYDALMSYFDLEDYTSTRLLTKYLYGYSLIAEPNAEITDSGLIPDPQKGPIVSSSLTYTATVQASATHKDPDDLRAKFYYDWWDEDNLRSSTVATSLSSPITETLTANEYAMYDDWIVTNDHRYGWLNYQMKRAEVQNDYTADIALTRPGLNQTLPLYLNVNYDIPYASCWTIVFYPYCEVKRQEGTLGQKIGDSIKMDIFPATLDEFYQWNWDPLLVSPKDHDGDGLLAIQYGGPDPNDLLADTDGDGLIDPYELELRASGDRAAATSLTNPDTDGDGLRDGDELRLGTLPNQRDSDGDGLDDGQEVFHLDWNDRDGDGSTTDWFGGWTYVISSTLETVNPVSMFVTSDPTNADTDGDGLNDGTEKALGENPTAWTPNPVTLTAQVSDADRIVAPGQTFVYTATLSNDMLEDPGYWITGTLTTTLSEGLEADPPGFSTLSSSYNIYQGTELAQTKVISVTSNTSGQISILSKAASWMHDGYPQPTYRWDPSPATLLTTTQTTGPVYASIAASPGAVQGDSGDLFALGTVEGSKKAGLSYIDAVFPDRSNALSSQTFPRTNYDFDNGPGLGSFPPGIACTDDGKCLTVFGNDYYDKNAYVFLDAIFGVANNDGLFDTTSEVYVEVPGERILGSHGTSMGNGALRAINRVKAYTNNINIRVWDWDRWSSNDQIGGTLNLNYHGGTQYGGIAFPQRMGIWNTDCFDPLFFDYLPPFIFFLNGQCDNSNLTSYFGRHYFNFQDYIDSDLGHNWNYDGYYYLYLENLLVKREGIYGAFEIPQGGIPAPAEIDTRMVDLASQNFGWITDVKQQPAVASDGNHFLTVWQSQAPNSSYAAGKTTKDAVNPSSAWWGDWQLFAKTVYDPVSGQSIPQRLDIWGGCNISDTDCGLANDTSPAVTWASGAANGEGRYVVAWQRTVPGGASSLQLATLYSQDGHLDERVELEASGNPASPKIAYNEKTNQVLVIYTKACEGGTCIKGRLVNLQDGIAAEAELDLGHQPYPGTKVIPSVAYEPKYDAWVVSWTATDTSNKPILYYVPLEANGDWLEKKDGRGYQAIFSDLQNTVSEFETADPLLSQSVACSDPGSDFARCDIVASTKDRLYLQPLYLVEQGNQPVNVAPSVMTVTVDTDGPITTIDLENGSTSTLSGTTIIGVNADDGPLGAGVDYIQVKFPGGDWQTGGQGAASWAFEWDVPDMAEVTIQAQAVDKLGNWGTISTVTIYLDHSGPSIGLDNQAANAVQATLDETKGLWQIPLTIQASDTSGIQAVRLSLTPYSSGWRDAIPAGDDHWTVNYTLNPLDSEGQALADPSGEYTASLWARDEAGNTSEMVVSEPLRVDNTPPVLSLTSTELFTHVITDTILLTGVITDSGIVSSGVNEVLISLTPAGHDPSNWQPAILNNPGGPVSDWQFQLPMGLEGLYQVNIRGSDLVGNQRENLEISQSLVEIDTNLPTADCQVSYLGSGSASQTHLEGWAQDFNLVKDGFEFLCPREQTRSFNYADDWYLNVISDTTRLFRLESACTLSGVYEAPTLKSQDLYGHSNSVSCNVGEPVPPVPVASIVRIPETGAVLTTTEPLSLTVGAHAELGLKTITVTVDGAPLASWMGNCESTPETNPELTSVITDTILTFDWDPPDAEGQHVLLSEAEDCTSQKQTDLQPVTVSFDLQPPVLELPVAVLSTTQRLSFNRVALTGLVTDTFGVSEVQVSLDLGGHWQEASVAGNTWRFPWSLGTSEEEPDGMQYQVSIRAEDYAGNLAQIDKTVTVDLRPPEPFAMTLSYDAGKGPQPLESGQIITQPNPNLTIDWTTSSDGNGPVTYLAGWSPDIRPDITLLTPSTSPYTQGFEQPQALYAHVISRDAAGNQQAQTIGPVYVDSRETPDFISDLDYHGWMDESCNLIDADREVARYAPATAVLDDIQKLYASWDERAMRLTWTGANWDHDGDLFIYLDTGPGGATTAYDPFTSGPVITLPTRFGDPFGADYLIWIQDSLTASLLSWNGSEWVSGNALTFDSYRFTYGNPSTTDLLLPWEWLGSPNSLKLLAIASEENNLHIWAAIPDKNPLNSTRAVNPIAEGLLDLPYALTHSYYLAQIGTGMCSDQGQPAGSDLHFNLTVDPAGVVANYLEDDLAGLLVPGQWLDQNQDGQIDVVLPLDQHSAWLGNSQPITYTLTYTNTGNAPAEGVVITLSSNGLEGIDPSISLPTILPGTGGSLTLQAAVTAEAGLSVELIAQVSDVRHGPYEWLWVQHSLDRQPPQDLSIDYPEKYIGPGVNQISGRASDPSGLASVELEITPGETSPVCTVPDPVAGFWSCQWVAPTDGDQFSIRVRASDRFGNTSDWSPVSIKTLDSEPPEVTLSTGSEAALADGLLFYDELWLSGTIIDNYQSSSVKVCAGPVSEPVPVCTKVGTSPEQPSAIADWSARVPVAGKLDGEDYLVTIAGYDAAGNRSLEPIIKPVNVDIFGPTVRVDLARESAPQAILMEMLAGKIQDGSGVQSLRVYAAQPDGVVVWSQPLNITTGDWSFSARFDQTGQYALGLEAKDLAGNISRYGPYGIEVYGSGAVADLLVTLSASSDPAISGFPLVYTATLTNAGPGIAVSPTMTITIPAEVNLQSVSDSCTVNSNGVICSQDQLLRDESVKYRIRVEVPEVVTQTLSCLTSASSALVDLNPDNNQAILYTKVVQPITGLSASSDSPTFLGNGTTLTATVQTGNYVLYEWDFGDGQTGYGPVVSHVYSPTQVNPATFPVLGVFTATITASNPFNQMTANTKIKVINSDPFVDTTGLDQLTYEDELIWSGYVLFNDLNIPDQHTATIDWGDGIVTPPDEFDDNSRPGTLLGSHIYTDPGVYTVTVSVYDAYGGVGTGQFVVTVLHGFMRYCSYAGGNPGVEIDSGANLDCGWNWGNSLARTSPSGIGSQYQILIEDGIVITGSLTSQSSQVMLGNASHLVGGEHLSDFGSLSIGNVTAERQVAVGDQSLVDGNVTGRSYVRLLPGSLVGGDVIANGLVQMDATAIVSGTVTQGAQIPPIPPVTPITFSFTAGKTDITVQQNTTIILDPGNYQALVVNKGGIVKLRSGHYTFKSIRLNQDAQVEYNLSDGAVVIDVVKNVIAGENVKMMITSEMGNAADILFRVMGTVVDLKNGGVYLGTYLAPDASVSLGQAARLTGALYGARVFINSMVQLIGMPARDIFATLFVNPEIGFSSPQTQTAAEISWPGFDLSSIFNEFGPSQPVSGVSRAPVLKRFGGRR